MANNNVFINGKIVPAAQATISAADAGLLHGASVFTTMLAHKGVIFRFDAHLDRLLTAVAKVNMRITADAESLREATYALLKANELAEARVRITLTPGVVSQPDAAPTVIVTADPLPEYPRQWYDEGLTVVVSDLKQSPEDITVGIKTGCYLPRIIARQAAAEKGADDALWYTTDNHLAEGCFSNVFLVLNGELFTPPEDTPILPGVVRAAVIELCEQLQIACHSDKSLTVHDMLAAEEIFLTSSCSAIRPVVRVERHAVGSEKPGEITKKLMAAYRELLDTECAQ